jgi:hypothetical protein
MASSLSAVNSNGVHRDVIDAVELFRRRQEDPTHNHHQRRCLSIYEAVLQRDAEYIVECLRVLLQQERIAERGIFALCSNCGVDGTISDGAIDIFAGFLREMPCQLQALYLLEDLPPPQVRRLLEALHTNRSVKALRISSLKGDEGALWVADLLRHKADFTELGFYWCRFSFTQILPLLREQRNLTVVAFDSCHVNNEDVLLFNDPEFTLLFINNILLSPRTRNTVKELWVSRCGMTMKNRPLIAGIHKNTTLLEFGTGNGDDATTLFIGPTMRRNLYLGHIRGMLGTTSIGQRYRANIALPPPLPPPPEHLLPFRRRAAYGL